MGIFFNKPKMDSKQKFLDTIRKEYYDLTQGNLNPDLVNTVSERVTDYYYDQYLRFRKKYPKSIKRYSSFQIKDLDHPTTHALIIKTLKELVENDYKKPTTIFLKMTIDELNKFEKSREEFYKMF